MAPTVIEKVAVSADEVKQHPSKRILLGQLNSNGDCLFATTIARQIKVDYPGCHLTWAISSACRSMIEGNPDVDEVWEISPANPTDMELWRKFELEALARQKRGEFDEIFLTQISPAHMENWVSSVRSGIFRAYPRPITVPVSPVLKLMPSEVEKVRLFAEEHRLGESAAVILFECAPRSEQSKMTPDKALALAERLIQSNPNTSIVLSSNTSIASTHPRIVDGSVLSLRENAELTKYCTLLVGSSSGITWVSTSDWAKPLPMLQLLAPNLIQSNSVVVDHEEQNLSTNQIIEWYRYSTEDIYQCTETILRAGFSAAQIRFHQAIPHNFIGYKSIQHFLVQRGRYRASGVLMRRALKRYGFHLEIILIPVGFLFMKYLPWPFQLLFWIKRTVSRLIGTRARFRD